MRLAAGLLVAVVELFAGALFDVNGPNWHWWSVVMDVLAVLTVVLVLRRGFRVPYAFPLAGAGLVAAAAAIVVQSQRYNDSYLGSRVWPDVLACVFGAGVAAVEISASARLRSGRAAA